MTEKMLFHLKNTKFSSFFADNPDFDLRIHDFFAPDAQERLRGAPTALRETLEALRPHQRLLRLLPSAGHWQALGADSANGDAEHLIQGLLDRGYASAHDIASLSPHRFVRATRDLFGNDEIPREVHRRATQVKAAVRHLFANVRDVTGSALTTTGLAPFAESDLTSYFRGIPSYQSLFGSLDYLEVRECESIFSPAAYFLDIMRITDEYITYYNQETIPPGYTLEDRRPDLFDSVKLCCEATETPIPTVSLVLEIFVRKLTRDLGADPYPVVATAPYPFTLPFNRPRTEIAAALQKLGVTLSDVGQAMLAADPAAPGFATAALGRAFLGLSPEQAAELTTVNTGDAAIGAQYGLASIAAALPRAGTGTISYAQNGLSASGANGQLGTLLRVGQSFESQGQIRTVVKKIDAASVEIDIPWVQAGTNVAWTIYGAPVDLTDGATFRTRVGDMTFQALQALVTQNLSVTERASGAANAFFINNTGESLPPLAVVEADAAKGNVAARLVPLSAKRLDRLSRFIRLSRLTGIDATTLDWLMRIGGASEITDSLLTLLAGLRQLSALLDIEPAQAAALIGPFKTSGRGNDVVPSDPFDLTFNPPSLLGGANPRVAATPIPFDPSRPLAWAPHGLTGPGIEGKIAAATATTVTLSNDASAVDNAYAGLQIAVTGGPGSGQTSIIKTYDGARRIATLYAPWTTVPTSQSAYRLGNATGLEDRLAAALQLDKSDLPALGDAYKEANAASAPALLLGLDTLTGLWRLAKMAWLHRLPIGEYLLTRSLAGLSLTFKTTAPEALADAQTAAAAVAWLREHDLSAYELAYILRGERSRYIRPVFNPEDIPGILADLASSSAATHLTTQSLIQAGFGESDAAALRAGLESMGLLDAQGLILPHESLFAQIAARFPVTEAELSAAAALSGSEALATITTLSTQTPPALQAIATKPGTWHVTAAYPPQSPLDTLFVGLDDAQNKRMAVSRYLDGKVARTTFDCLSPLFPLIGAEVFRSQEIGAPQSLAVFNALKATTPPVILAESATGPGSLSADYDGDTSGWRLFQSEATGQSGLIASYDPQTRAATVATPWTTVPDAFTFFRIVQNQQSGTARAATATTLTLADNAAPTDDAYTGFVLTVTGGTGQGQRRLIQGYAGATRTATVSDAWDPVPTASSTYAVEATVLTGNAEGGTATTIRLGPDASTIPDAYQGLTIALVADPEADSKTTQVAAVLNGVHQQVVLLAQTLASTAEVQQAAAVGGLGTVLSMSTVNVLAGLPYASATASQPRQVAPIVLGGNTEANRIAGAAILDGLSRVAMLREKIVFGAPVWEAIACQPFLFNLGATSALSFADLRRLGGFKDFTQAIGDDGSGTAAYLQLWPAVVGLADQLDALYRLTGWPAGQSAALDAFLSKTVPGYAGIGRLDGVLRLASPFALIDATASDAAYLISLTGVITAPALAAIGQTPSAASWNALSATADATVAVVAARYKDQDFAAVADQLRRSTDTEKRDALRGYLIWTLNKTIPEITQPSDLFQFLLIDVETSGCDTTSVIAQGITSVQLYMQRCRMGLEPGVTVNHIPGPWWDWMAAYRLWEVNRKIFLYPENYLVASQRSTATPEFHALGDELLQSRPTEQAVAKAMVSYFNAFEALANLVPVGGCKATQQEMEGGQINELAVLVARTNTSPYKYYMRSWVRSCLPERGEAGQDPLIFLWEPWESVETTIDADYVTPAWAFDRPFLFWNEITPAKSSSIDTTSGSNGGQTASNTQSTWQTTLKYSFPSSTGEWLSAQKLADAVPIRIAPNTYLPANDPNMKAAFLNTQHYWNQPFAQSIPRGLPGTGTLGFSAGTKTATGTKTRLEKQVAPGDFIFTAGQKVQVAAIDTASQTITTKTAFQRSATATPFNVIPKDPRKVRYSPYTGPGTVKIIAGTNIADGVGTAFTIDFTPGDFIQVGTDTRTVAAIFSDTQIVIRGQWSVSSQRDGQGTVTLFRNLTAVAGNGSAFLRQAAPGDQLIVGSQSRTILEIEDDTSLLVDSPFTISATTTSAYKLGVSGAYKVLPRADGNERLIVLYGPNLDLQVNYGKTPDTPPKDDNPGDDPFISATYEYNLNLYNSLNLLQVVKNDPSLPQTGNVTGQPSLMLDAALTNADIRLFVPSVTPTVQNVSPLIRLALDRENNLLFTRMNQGALVSLYWGNSAKGTTANQISYSPADRPLLHHTNSENAVLIALGNQVGWYLLNNNSDSFLLTLENPVPVPVGAGAVLRTFWQPNSSGDLQMEVGPYSLASTPFSDLKYRLTRLSTDVAQPLKQRLFLGIGTLLSLDSQFLQENPVNQYFQTPDSPPPAALDDDHLPPDLMSFDGAWGLYFWEIFYHAPMLVAEWLKENQDFETAKGWYEYVFNPMAVDDDHGGTGNTRYWQFRPFRENMTIPSLKRILLNTAEINVSNNDPFDPHAIARLRISAYAKSTVLNYIDNLIKWADALFTQDTRESVAQATNLYVLARDLLGQPPEVVGVFEQPEKLTFNQIKAKYAPNGIPQYLIDLENTPFLPASGQGQSYADVPVNDIHAYFGVPDNQEIRAYWEVIDDRLFKIRHCMNINGVVRQLALFAPPIDPAALIAGIAAGGSLSGGAAYCPYPIPNYRFKFLIEMAKSLADRVVNFGASLLSALEHKDGEDLAILTLTQQTALLELTTEIKQQTITQIANQEQDLQEALKGAQARQTHYQGLLNRGMLGEEIAEMTLMGLSSISAGGASVFSAAASVASNFPQLGSPFAITFGGQQVGRGLQNAAGWMEAIAKVLETTAGILGIVANYKRQAEEWDLQKQLAGFDIAQFQAQIAANGVQKTIAERDLLIHKTQINQNKAQQEFYTGKFTNDTLYKWMAGRLATTHFQAYSLALEFARMAQRAYQYECRTSTAFIAATYWDDLYKGLTAGESLSQALSQLEAAYVRGTSRSQNITKILSLRQHDPVAFLTLIRTGETQFDLSERVFDEDFPGHYRRRIQSVKVTIDPDQPIHATLTQTGNRVVLTPDINAVKLLLGDNVSVKEGVIEHNVRCYQRISLSQGEGDTGVFDLDPNDPLYLPFEQTGAISSWRLSLPMANNLIDFTHLSDVVMEIRYSALDGGDAFRAQVAALPQVRERSWSQVIQPAVQYENEWSQFMSGPVIGSRQTLSFEAGGLVPPNIAKPQVLGVFLQLQIPPGTALGSRNPYLSVAVGASGSVALLPRSDGTALALFDRPLPLKTAETTLKVLFDLQPGYTPTSLRTESGDRLNGAVLTDIDIVVLLAGKT